MNRDGPEAARLWLQIEIAQAGTELRATARGCHGEEPAAHLLGAQASSDVLHQFSEWVKEAAARGSPLTPPAQAQQLYQALFREGLQEVLLRLQGAAQGEPLLLRLTPGDPELHAVPWEALCRPGTTLDFLGTSPELCIARGAHSMKSFEACRVEGAVRLLVISPTDARAPERLRAALQPGIQAGELEWLTPLTGAHASTEAVQQRLRQQPVPHILHFIGHGGLDEGGNPTLRLADSEEEESWPKVELLAKELEALFRQELRLVVLEACEGARPGTLPSAAVLLAQAGAGAVVAHLWPVRADVARRCSASFYRSLSGTAVHRGDVGRSLHDARRTLLAKFKESAEAFSPVLYLRGHDTLLFDFQGRKLPPRRRVRWVAGSALALVPLSVMASLYFHRGAEQHGAPEPSQQQSSPPTAQAEEQNLAGLIHDEAGDPLANVVVVLPKLGAKAITDENGYFQLRVRAEKEARVDLMARKEGHQTYETDAHLGNTGLDFVMKKR
jgi:CHAT domain